MLSRGKVCVGVVIKKKNTAGKEREKAGMLKWERKQGLMEGEGEWMITWRRRREEKKSA